MSVMSFVTLVTISTFPFCPVPTWLVDLLGLVSWGLSSGRLAAPFTMSTALAGVKHLLIMAVLTVLSFPARFLDEVEVTWYLLFVARTGTSAL